MTMPCWSEKKLSVTTKPLSDSESSRGAAGSRRPIPGTHSSYLVARALLLGRRWSRAQRALPLANKPRDSQSTGLCLREGEHCVQASSTVHEVRLSLPHYAPPVLITRRVLPVLRGREGLRCDVTY